MQSFMVNLAEAFLGPVFVLAGFCESRKISEAEISISKLKRNHPLQTACVKLNMFLIYKVQQPRVV